MASLPGFSQLNYRSMPGKYALETNKTFDNDSVTVKSNLLFRPILRLAPDLYTSGFGFFCRKELQLEKVSNLKLRVRLGSIQQCDLLEGKEKALTIRP